jgi:hypothetical protein
MALSAAVSLATSIPGAGEPVTRGLGQIGDVFLAASTIL